MTDLIVGVGLVLVIEPWHGLGGFASTLMALGAGICWALAVVVSKRLFARAGAGVTPLSLTTWQMLYGAIVLVAVAAFFASVALRRLRPASS